MKPSKTTIYVGVFILAFLVYIGFSISPFKISKEVPGENSTGDLLEQKVDNPQRDLIEESNIDTKESPIEEENRHTSPYPSVDEPEIDTEGTLIRVFKKQRLLKLYVDGQLVGDFKVGLGSSPLGDKNKEGDGKTPVGKYYICTRNDKSRFTLFLGLSYPNVEDAKRGLDNTLIDENTFNKIKAANERKVQPPWKTSLGGEVGIHGSGNSSDWTLGCVALSDEDIKTIWKYAKLKTPVEIYE